MILGLIEARSGRRKSSSISLVLYRMVTVV